MPKKVKEFVEPVEPAANPPQRSYKYIATIFILAAIVLLIGVAYLVLAQATIVLTAADEPLQESFELTITENAATSTSTNPVVAGKIFSERISATEEYQVTHGGKKIEAVATGKVIIYNKRNQAQTLVATTRLLSEDGVLFRLKDKVIVPANGDVEASVYADKAGKSGEVMATTFTIPGLSAEVQKLIYAESREPMRGGEREIGVLTEADVEKAMSEFKKTQLEKVVTKLLAQMENTDWVLVGGGIEPNDQKLSYDKKLGEEVSAFNLQGEMTVGAVFAEKQKMLDKATEELQKTRGNNGGEVNVDPESFQYELEGMNLEGKEATAKVSLSGMVNFDPTKNIFDKNILVGFTESDLKLYFSQFNAINDVRVEFSPFWVKKVPILKDHITIKIQGNDND